MTSINTDQNIRRAIANLNLAQNCQSIKGRNVAVKQSINLLMSLTDEEFRFFKRDIENDCDYCPIDDQCFWCGSKPMTGLSSVSV